MASFEKRSGAWRVTIRLRGQRESATFSTKAAAAAWASEREREILRVAEGGLPNRSVREALVRYRDEVSPSKRGALWEVRRLDAFLGVAKPAPGRTAQPPVLGALLDLPIAAVTTADLAGWRTARLRKVAASTVSREINLLSAVFETARKEWMWIRTRPFSDLARPQSPPARKQRISDADALRLCLALGFDETKPVSNKSHQIAVALLLGIETAMRRGEMLALRWSDVRGKVAHLPMTKNGQAREVPLSRRAVALLEKLRGLDAARCFTVAPATADTLYRAAKLRAGLPGINFHDSRREGTSRLSKKVDVLTLARITGHKDLNELMTYYQTDMAEVARGLD